MTPSSTIIGRGRLQESTNELGETLRFYRIKRGLTIAELASAVGVDRAFLFQLEDAEADWLNPPLDAHPPRQPTRDLVIRIGIALRLDLSEVDDLLATAGYRPLWRG